jgi:putative membrane protein
VAERAVTPGEQASRATLALAEERTLLAWVRTGLALMGFGFVVARFGLFLREVTVLHPGPQPRGSGLSVWFGSGLVIVGVGVNAIAALQHARRMAMLNDGEIFRPRARFGVGVALLLAAIGVGMASYLLLLARE